MDYKEKYEQALEKAQKVLETPYTAHWDKHKELIEHIFPELAESEDERIRKRIIALVNSHGQGMYKDEMLAWLEKQGEQKPTDKIKPKFKIGQTIKKEGFNLGFTIAKIEDGFYYSDEGDYLPFTDQDNWELVEQNPAWSEDDETALGDALWCCKQAASIAKDENDMGNVWYAERWLKSLKDRVLPQPKREWSEEDESIYNAILDTVNNDLGLIWVHRDWFKNIKYRLKSLHPQKQWKPSELDILLLERMANGKSNPQDFQASLYALIEQLKKLKG